MEKLWINVTEEEFKEFLNWVNENKGEYTYLFWSVSDSSVYFLKEDDKCENPICKRFSGGDPELFVILEEMYNEFKGL
jgi:hypothetical protein